MLIETMIRIIRTHGRKVDEENKKQIERYFEQEKYFINSGHKDFGINFERKTGQSETHSTALELNVLDLNDRKEFYQSKRDMLEDLMDDDAVILEACLKHLKIIQDSLSDKLPKIIHYEIFHSTKNFIEEELANELINAWKKNKDIMAPNESERRRKQKLEKDIKNYENALVIINEMMTLIRNFQNQDQLNQNEYSEDDLDEGPLRIERNEISDDLTYQNSADTNNRVNKQSFHAMTSMTDRLRNWNA